LDYRITTAISAPGETKTLTPSLSLKIRLRFFPGTRTYCPGRRRRKGSSCSVLRPDLFRNCAATGELYPWSQLSDCVSSFRLVEVSIDFEQNQIINHTLDKVYSLKPLMGPVIDAGGIFAYARQTGMITRT